MGDTAFWCRKCDSWHPHDGRCRTGGDDYQITPLVAELRKVGGDVSIVCASNRWYIKAGNHLLAQADAGEPDFDLGLLLVLRAAVDEARRRLEEHDRRRRTEERFSG